MSTHPKPKNIVPNPLTITPARFLRLEACLLGRKQRLVLKAKSASPATRAKRLVISRPPIFKPALAIAMKSEESVRAANSTAPAVVDEAREALEVLEDLERFLIRDVGAGGGLTLDNCGQWADDLADCRKKIEDQRAEIAEMEAS